VVSSFWSVSVVLENYDTLVRNMLKMQSMILQDIKKTHIYNRYYSKKITCREFLLDLEFLCNAHLELSE